ncbi:hypothetical protein [Parendozoicomonas haliclonae]|uniref:Uncharacterized protein n=1 Tax=Parendozoicomonas haliclonae TaxID=1960125 RepID=A0A1X7AIQ9_9GAMM|nr:hypothetical protein [Parendozoicomonas haliclonae]SMA44394.1 hypothetical protein EHSB41UT_01792 [Parendozoicomonas haliclonae]
MYLTTKRKITVYLDSNTIAPASITEVIDELSQYGEICCFRLFSQTGADTHEAQMLKSLVNEYSQHIAIERISADELVDAKPDFHSDIVSFASNRNVFSSIANASRINNQLTLGFGGAGSPMGFKQTCHAFYQLNIAQNSPQRCSNSSHFYLSSTVLNPQRDERPCQLSTLRNWGKRQKNLTAQDAIRRFRISMPEQQQTLKVCA